MDLKMVTFVCSPKMTQIILTGQSKVLQQEIQNIPQIQDLMLIVVAPKKVCRHKIIFRKIFSLGHLEILSIKLPGYLNIYLSL